MEEEGDAATDPLACKPWHVSLKLRIIHINKLKYVFIVWRLCKKYWKLLGEYRS